MTHSEENLGYNFFNQNLIENLNWRILNHEGVGAKTSQILAESKKRVKLLTQIFDTNFASLKRQGCQKK